MSRLVSLAPRFVFAAGVTALVLGYSRRGAMPDEAAVDSSLLSEPVQGPTDRKPFAVDYEGVTYEVEPVATYDITGVVVTHNDITAIGDDDHDETSIDTKDLCVVWGKNVSSGHFRRAEFWSNDWTCYWQYPAESPIDSASISNNHLIAGEDGIRKKIAEIRVGDQVRVTGLLVSYRHPDWPRPRRTSTTRTDVGGTACEVVYVESIDIIRKAPRLWYGLVPVGWTLTLGAFAIGLFAALRRPAFVRPETPEPAPEERPPDPRLGRFRRE